MAEVELDSSKYQNLGKGEIATTGLMLLSFIPVNLNNKTERAVNYLIDEKNGDELVNISIRESWFWAWVLNGYKVHVEGTVVKSKMKK